MPAKPIPDGYHTITPYLIVEGVAALVPFLERAFDAEPTYRLDRPDGSIMHVEVRIGDSVVMLGEPTGEFAAMPGCLFLYVDDCDAVYHQAIATGGVSVMEPADMLHAGERYGGVRDPSGNLWWIATHTEDVSPEEAARRVEQMAKQGRWMKEE